MAPVHQVLAAQGPDSHRRILKQQAAAVVQEGSLVLQDLLVPEVLELVVRGDYMVAVAAAVMLVVLVPEHLEHCVLYGVAVGRIQALVLQTHQLT
jgi:hypothetical protein